jgi:hypothetical protein
VLDTGQVMLLKHYRVFYNDTRTYSSANITRIYDEEIAYYISFPDGTMKKLEKKKDEVLEVFNDKKTKIAQFIDRENIKCRKESELKKVVAYYNTL